MFVESNKVLASIKCDLSIYYEYQWRSKLSLVSRSFLNIFLSFSGCREVWPDQASFSVSFINWFWSSVDIQIMVWMCRCDISLSCASKDVAHSVGQRFCFIAILRVERVFWQNIVNHGVWVTRVTEFDFIKSSSTSRISVCPVSIVIVCHSESVLHKNRHPKPVLNIHLILQAGPSHTFKYIVSIQTSKKFSN